MTTNKIREKRIALGLSQVQLGFLIGVPNSVVSDWELGKRYVWPKGREALLRVFEADESEVFPEENHGGD
jgi:transcriptional regulator with XRE-family HTH domain